MITEIRLRGYIVGPIWWPVGQECYKPLDHCLVRGTRCPRWEGTLRDLVLEATSDGDFQSATLAHAELVVERQHGGRQVIRSWPLSRFPSVADCLHPEGDDWCPQGDLEA